MLSFFLCIGSFISFQHCVGILATTFSVSSMWLTKHWIWKDELLMDAPWKTHVLENWELRLIEQSYSKGSCDLWKRRPDLLPRKNYEIRQIFGQRRMPLSRNMSGSSVLLRHHPSRTQEARVFADVLACLVSLLMFELLWLFTTLSFYQYQHALPGLVFGRSSLLHFSKCLV